MAHRVERAVVLDVDVVDALLLDKRRGGGRDELIVLGRQDGDCRARLDNGRPVVQPGNGRATRGEIRAGPAPERAQKLPHVVADAQLHGELVQPCEVCAMSGRGNGDDVVDDGGHVPELGRVQGLEGAFGVADEVDLGRARFGPDLSDKGGDLVRGFVDGLEAAHEGEPVVVAVGEGEGAEALGLEPEVEEVDVLVVGGPEAVQQHDGVTGGLAGKVIVRDGSRVLGGWEGG